MSERSRHNAHTHKRHRASLQAQSPSEAAPGMASGSGASELLSLPALGLERPQVVVARSERSTRELMAVRASGSAKNLATPCGTAMALYSARIDVCCTVATKQSLSLQTSWLV